MKISDIALDPEKQEEGIWVQYRSTDIGLLTARMFNPKMVEFVTRMRDELANEISGELSDADTEDITFKAIVRYVFKGWRNVEDDDGNPIEYNEEVAHYYFKERAAEFSDLFTFWTQKANDRELFLRRKEDGSRKK